VGAGGLSASLMTHSIGLPPILATGSTAAEKQDRARGAGRDHSFALGITEPSGGSDVANLKTRAIAKGGHYVVNGSQNLRSPPGCGPII